MTYIPFHMLDLPGTYGLGLTAGINLMVLAALGIAIPSPGGTGTFHFLVTLGLSVLYGVPEEIALTYATVSHGATYIYFLIAVPVMYGIGRVWFNEKKKSQEPATQTGP